VWFEEPEKTGFLFQLFFFRGFGIFIWWFISRIQRRRLKAFLLLNLAFS
jgi:hypothetical protein